MAVGDLYYNTVHMSTNNRNWSWSFWLKETLVYSEPQDAGPIANALFVHFFAQLVNVISTDTFIESFNSWKRFDGSSRPGQTLMVTTPGERVGGAMSNDNALYVNLRQDTVNAKFNGGFYMAGQSNNDQDNNVFDDNYLSTQVKTFTDRFEEPLVITIGGTGSFAFAVLSKAFTPPTTPIGTGFEVFRAVASNRVHTQRRRRQKVRGWSG